MPTIASAHECYQALLERNAAYEGLFFVGVRTTGVFCRPTCPARKPKFANCAFFETSAQAQRAGYRPCLRCRPLDPPGVAPDVVQQLADAVERNPERRWSERDFQRFGIDPSTARRQFKKRFGMTFIAYARAHRLGHALHRICDGARVIDAQVDAGYTSGSGFREAFARIIGVPPVQAERDAALRAAWVDTPLGTMVTIADAEALFLLEFADSPLLERQLKQLRRHMPAAIIPGQTPASRSITDELERYFAGELERFETPVRLRGTELQRRVWETLRTVPYGATHSYSELAARVGRPSAVRAVAAANGANLLSIVVPCHRIAGKRGDLTGYSGGLARKRWLLQHESEKRLTHGPTD